MATILSGKEVAADVRKQLKAEISEVRLNHPDLVPHLTIVQVGNREDSNVYIKMKKKAGDEVGIKVTHLKLPQSTSEAELISEINRLNRLLSCVLPVFTGYLFLVCFVYVHVKVVFVI